MYSPLTSPLFHADADDLTSTFSNPSASFTPYESSRPTLRFSESENHASQTQIHKPRKGLLSAATDVLGLRRKFGSISRKKPSHSTVPHAAQVMPDVIEISARNDILVTSSGATSAYKDHEHEERERLRDAAAQSIGLDPDLLLSSPRSLSSLDSSHMQSPSQPAPMPSFPATLAVLSTLTQMSATLPKFSPPSSLLVYALAKQWKPRTILLTSHEETQKTHVHLFKSAAPDEIEVERLEITEESVIFVAEEEVGGRGNVVKLAGKRCCSGTDESALTMWFLQMADPLESQRWIATIKNAVLSQRSIRAGLNVQVHTDSDCEPRGDMDVVLSMRLQRAQPMKLDIAATPPVLPKGVSPAHTPSPSSSLRSFRLNMPSPSPAAAIKGIFTGPRSRSPSVDASRVPAQPQGHTEDSFSAMGASLLTMLRTNATPDASSSPSHSLPFPLPYAQGQSSPAPSVRSTSTTVVIPASDLKISKERDVPGFSPSPPSSGSLGTPPSSGTPTIAFQSTPGALAFSLQPPPRKVKHTSTPIITSSEQRQQGIYQQTDGHQSVEGSFGIVSDTSSDVRSPWPASPVPRLRSMSPCEENGIMSPETVSTGEMSPPDSSDLRRGGASSIVNYCSACPPTDERVGGEGDMTLTVPSDDSPSRNPSTSKRWSRQAVHIPKRPRPPSGPPPSIPYCPDRDHRASFTLHPHTLHPYAADRPPSSASSNSYTYGRPSPQSVSPLSPTFRKRTSDSSAYSVSSASTSASRAMARMSETLGGSMPSVGPSVGTGRSPRAMSLSAPGLSPMTHTGSAKRRSMPPPRPAPSFAPPPAPGSETLSTFPLTQRKSLRNSIAQRALRLSLTSPKPPPSTDLPPRPDEVEYNQSHRRSTSNGNAAATTTSELYSIPASPSRLSSTLSQMSSPTNQPPGSSASSTRSMSIKQRLRILSSPSSPTFTPPGPVSTLNLDDDTHRPSRVQTPHSFALGEHITTMQNDPSFLQLSTPVTPTAPKPPPRSPFRPLPSTSPSLHPFEPEQEFISLSPPPPRRFSKQVAASVPYPDRLESELPDLSDTISLHKEDDKLVRLSQRGSMVSLGFVTM
ncbi:hypothetical protein F5I97DRAFT_1928733 [Phlebopus sp. FC_14]|nr:hypothetical protein F5I97DRAFT_1928733 [Phlebopus sp. FC_14]